jgi:hypothetical protein
MCMFAFLAQILLELSYLHKLKLAFLWVLSLYLSLVHQIEILNFSVILLAVL